MLDQWPRHSGRCRGCARPIFFDTAEELKKFGLDQPNLEIAWESDRAHRLMVGAQVPRTAAYYARTDDNPFIFTIKTEVLKPFEAEFRDHTVLAFPEAKAQRVVSLGLAKTLRRLPSAPPKRQRDRTNGSTSPAPMRPASTSRTSSRW